ncbi:hypothetical protein FOQG_19508 [Fusarium oxysporum f. sp. raphani 54005]|uniref:C2H2-type domain-containing protein n=1 Tax=Fusarium oxysporum f. sp. raphani 54005 TaxID=1089458 RepID=X0BA91_FUSOX|nr:hypothetical protein FOQG_19508 [Fusarium oxysporum f. sp. raphani 54005]
MPSFICQICYNDFDSANALRQHYDEFENQERELNQEYELCRKHDLSEPRSDGPNVCQRCEQCFFTIEALDDHVQDYMTRELLLLGRIARCRLHRPIIELDYARNQKQECPKNGCEQNIRDKSNLKRHFESHIDCYCICPSCSEGFSMTDAFLRHKTCTGRQISRLKASVRRRVTRKFNSAMDQSPMIVKRQHTPEPEFPSKKPAQQHLPSLEADTAPSQNSLINPSQSIPIHGVVCSPADGQGGVTGRIDDLQGDFFNTTHDNLLNPISLLGDGRYFTLAPAGVEYSDDGLFYTLPWS